MSATGTPVASVAGAGAASGAAPSPSADLENSPLGTPGAGGDGAGGDSAGSEADRGTGDGQRPGESESDAGAAGEQASGADADGRAIPAKWRELAKTDPEFKALFFERRDFHKEFPEGIVGVRKLKETLEGVGGEAGLRSMQEDVNEFRTLANLFLDGDPGYVKDLFESDAVAAASHVEPMLDAYREADEPGYNRAIAKRIYSEHAAWGLRAALKKAYDAIPAENTEARQILNGIAGWDDRLKQVAEQEDDPRVKKLQDTIRQGRKTADQQHLQELNTQYLAESKQSIDKAASRILDSFLKGRKLSEDDRASMVEQIMLRANRAILADNDFISQRDSVFKRRDKAASVKLAVTRWERELNVVIPRVVRLFGLGSPKPAAGAGDGGGNAGAGAGNGNGAAARTSVAGFTKVATLPTPNTIDWSRTTNDMIAKEHRCYVKGRKDGVYWELAG